jgi:hypothetical protein
LSADNYTWVLMVTATHGVHHRNPRS